MVDKIREIEHILRQDSRYPELTSEDVRNLFENPIHRIIGEYVLDLSPSFKMSDLEGISINYDYLINNFSEDYKFIYFILDKTFFEAKKIFDIFVKNGSSFIYDYEGTNVYVLDNISGNNYLNEVISNNLFEDNQIEYNTQVTLTRDNIAEIVEVVTDISNDIEFEEDILQKIFHFKFFDKINLPIISEVTKKNIVEIQKWLKKEHYGMITVTFTVTENNVLADIDLDLLKKQEELFRKNPLDMERAGIFINEVVDFIGDEIPVVGTVKRAFDLTSSLVDYMEKGELEQNNLYNEFIKSGITYFNEFFKIWVRKEFQKATRFFNLEEEDIQYESIVNRNYDIFISYYREKFNNLEEDIKKKIIDSMSYMWDENDELARDTVIFCGLVSIDIGIL